MGKLLEVTSTRNPAVLRAKRVASDAAWARAEGLCWIEGDHLLGAAVARGMRVLDAFVLDTAVDQRNARACTQAASRAYVVSRDVMQRLSSLESAASIAAVVALPGAESVDPKAATLILDRLQDPGNVGSMLRSASAFEFKQVFALPGTVALWSPKVLRAGMGSHFALRLFEQVSPAQLDALEVPWVGTSSHAAMALDAALLPYPCAWLMGHEGQGVSQTWLDRCATTVRIEQPGGEESLNAAVAAGICMHASRRRGG